MKWDGESREKGARDMLIWVIPLYGFLRMMVEPGRSLSSTIIFDRLEP